MKADLAAIDFVTNGCTRLLALIVDFFDVRYIVIRYEHVSPFVAWCQTVEPSVLSSISGYQSMVLWAGILGC
jgi:hypothetical protein